MLQDGPSVFSAAAADCFVWANLNFWEVRPMLQDGPSVTGIWDGFVPWTGISWATGHSHCIHCLLEGVPALRPLVVP